MKCACIRGYTQTFILLQNFNMVSPEVGKWELRDQSNSGSFLSNAYTVVISFGEELSREDVSHYQLTC